MGHERISHTADGSWLLQWLKDGNERLLDFYGNGEVIALGQDSEDPEKDAICELTIADREWIERFAKVGWRFAAQQPTDP